MAGKRLTILGSGDSGSDRLLLGWARVRPLD